jgi:hypothetical protein
MNPYEFLQSPALTVFIGFGARQICSQEFIHLGKRVDRPGKKLKPFQGRREYAERMRAWRRPGLA